MALGVAIGAFGAHALKEYFLQFPKHKEYYQTAVQYHFVHALGLFAVAWCHTKWQSQLIIKAGYCLCFGIFVFSGSLYALSLSQIKVFGAIVPIGGIAFIAAWILLLIGIVLSKETKSETV